MRVAVVGSGPSGLSCCKALLSRGFHVTLLDVAERLEDSRQRVVDDLRSTNPAQWPASSLAFIRENPSVTAGGIPTKLHFGSDFIYGKNRDFAPLDVADASASPTFAQGGYSNVWGATALPPDDCDLTGWPLTRGDLEPYFRQTLEDMPLCVGEDPLRKSFPVYKTDPGRLDPGIQGRGLLEDLRRAEQRLAQRHTLFGQSRLAIHAIDKGAEALGCVNCGLCLSGCPRGSIYSTVPELESLVKRGLIEYFPGAHVDEIHEHGDRAVVSFTNTVSGERAAQAYDAVFIGAGPINTTRILLASRQMFDRPVEMLESQKFLVPILRLPDSPGALDDKFATLACAFLETKIPELSDHWIHVQISSVNDMMLSSLGIDPERPTVRRTLLAPVLRRMMVAWCGLHSDHSSRLALTLRFAQRNGRHEMSIRGELSEEARRVSKRVAKVLFSLGLLFRSGFLFPFMRYSDPGTGNHFGGSFPMSRSPKRELDTDLFGRPFGWKRIFAIDSTVFPSIPATTIALAVMANARRIGATAPVL